MTTISLRHLLATIVCACSCLAVCRAQYNAAFDSAYRTAAVLPEPAARLARFRPLVNQSYESSVFQVIAFGKAMLEAASAIRSDTDLYLAHTVLGAGFERARDYHEAVAHGLQALSIAGQRNDYLRQVRALQNIAATYSSLGFMSGDAADFTKSHDYSNRALDIATTHSFKSEEPYILTAAADAYAMAKSYDTAISLYRRAIASRRGHGVEVGDESTWCNLGIALNLNKEYGAALAAYAKADSICDAQHLGTFSKLKIASNRAELFSDMGRLQESEALAQQILDSARQTGATDIQVDMVEHLKNLYRKEGRYAEALDYADTLADVRERMLDIGKTGQVAEMQARYDAGVKDQQIAGQAQTILQKRRQNELLRAGVALLAIAGGIAYAGMRRSRRLNKKIIAQQALLMRQKAELQRINETKDQLFSLIGHDLRTPLNSLTAYALLLEQEDALSPGKAKQYSADLRLTLGYTTALMENLLHFAKTQMHATRAYPEIHSLSDIAATAIALLQQAMRQKGLLLHTDFNDDTTAWCDEDMTELILRNLLSNAIKFSTAGGSIYFSIGPLDEMFICCTVRDEGAGMKQEQSALWNGTETPAPVRSTTGTQHEKGAGLGLMLSKTFAGMMSGSLWVESEEGKGAAFTLMLPRKKPGR